MKKNRDWHFTENKSCSPTSYHQDTEVKHRCTWLASFVDLLVLLQWTWACTSAHWELLTTDGWSRNRAYALQMTKRMRFRYQISIRPSENRPVTGWLFGAIVSSECHFLTLHEHAMWIQRKLASSNLLKNFDINNWDTESTLVCR